MKLYLIIILMIFSTIISASNLPESIYRFDIDIYSNKKLWKINKIQGFYGKNIKGYIYEDLEFPNGEVPPYDNESLKEILSWFDNGVYKLIEKYNIDTIKKDDSHEIIIIFDNIHDQKYYDNSPQKDYPAFFHKTFSKKYNNYIMIIDINYILDIGSKIFLRHEFQHVFRSSYNAKEEPWLDEGLSKFFEYQFVGIDCIDLEKFKNISNLSLKYDYSFPSATNFANNMLYIIYLYNNYGGPDLLQKLIKNKKCGSININDSLSFTKKLEKSDYKKNFYNFKKTFINYSLALVLNTHQDIIDSEGLLNFTTDKYDDLFDFKVEREEIDKKNYYNIRPWAARYYNLRQDCIKLPKVHKNLIVVFIDIYNEDASSKIQKITVPKRSTCVDSSNRFGQYLVIINPSDNNYSFHFDSDQLLWR